MVGSLNIVANCAALAGFLDPGHHVIWQTERPGPVTEAGSRSSFRSAAAQHKSAGPDLTHYDKTHLCWRSVTGLPSASRHRYMR